MRYSILAASLLCVSGAACYADTLTTFDFSATIAVPSDLTDVRGSASGTVTVDVTTGVVTGLNIFASATEPVLQILRPGSNDFFSDTFTTIASQESEVLTDSYEVQASSGSGGALTLILPGYSLVGYTGSAICSTAPLNCGAGAPGVYSSYQRLLNPGRDQILFTEDFTSGSLTPSTTLTPEPPGFVLLGTGMLSTLAGLRRRFM